MINSETIRPPHHSRAPLVSAQEVRADIRQPCSGQFSPSEGPPDDEEFDRRQKQEQADPSVRLLSAQHILEQLSCCQPFGEIRECLKRRYRLRCEDFQDFFVQPGPAQRREERETLVSEPGVKEQ
jgi:hypothetical protein